MMINITDRETDRLARALVAITGETMTDAMRDRLECEQNRTARSVAAQLRRIQDRIARVPVLDPRTADAIVGYGEDGVPVGQCDGPSILTPDDAEMPRARHDQPSSPTIIPENSAPDSASPPDDA